MCFLKIGLIKKKKKKSRKNNKLIFENVSMTQSINKDVYGKKRLLTPGDDFV